MGLQWDCSRATKHYIRKLRIHLYTGLYFPSQKVFERTDLVERATLILTSPDISEKQRRHAVGTTGPHDHYMSAKRIL